MIDRYLARVEANFADYGVLLAIRAEVSADDSLDLFERGQVLSRVDQYLADLGRRVEGRRLADARRIVRDG